MSKRRCWWTENANSWFRWQKEHPEEPCQHGQVVLLGADPRGEFEALTKCVICGHRWDSAQAYYEWKEERCDSAV